MFRQVSDLANILRPVSTALDLGQSDKTTIADACNIFMNLLNEPVLQDLCDKVQKRFDLVLKPCHLVAYMFHPKYLGAGLTLEQIETVKEWLISKDEAFFPGALLSKQKQPLFQLPSSPPEAGPATHWLVESLVLIINRSPRWLHRLHGGATVCSGIICSSGVSLQ